MPLTPPEENFTDLIYPADKEGNPASVMMAVVEMTPGRPGKYLPVKADPLTGELIVQIAGAGPAAGNPLAQFSHADGTRDLALLDLIRRQVVVPNVATPNFVLMHDHITAANVETTVPIDPKGYNGALGASKLVVDIDIQTPGGYVTLQPVVWNPKLDKYIPGIPSPRITMSQRIYLSIESPEDIYLMPVEVNGTVSVAVAGV